MLQKLSISSITLYVLFKVDTKETIKSEKWIKDKTKQVIAITGRNFFGTLVLQCVKVTRTPENPASKALFPFDLEFQTMGVYSGREISF